MLKQPGGGGAIVADLLNEKKENLHSQEMNEKLFTSCL
jgi:hypothetical protein